MAGVVKLTSEAWRTPYEPQRSEPKARGWSTVHGELTAALFGVHNGAKMTRGARQRTAMAALGLRRWRGDSASEAAAYARAG